MKAIKEISFLISCVSGLIEKRETVTADVLTYWRGRVEDIAQKNATTGKEGEAVARLRAALSQLHEGDTADTVRAFRGALRAEILASTGAPSLTKYKSVAAFACQEKLEKTLRPVLCGTYHDEAHRVAVASDGHILKASPAEYRDEFAGKIISKLGHEIEGRFVNWASVVPSEGAPLVPSLTVAELRDELRAVAAFRKELNYIYVSDDEHTPIFIGTVNGEKYAVSIRCAHVLLSVGLDGWTAQDTTRALVKKTDDGTTFLIMPVLLNTDHDFNLGAHPTPHTSTAEVAADYFDDEPRQEDTTATAQTSADVTATAEDIDTTTQTAQTAQEGDTTADTLAPVVAIADELTTAEDVTAQEDTTATPDEDTAHGSAELTTAQTSEDTTTTTAQEYTTATDGDTLAPVVSAELRKAIKAYIYYAIDSRNYSDRLTTCPPSEDTRARRLVWENKIRVTDTAVFMNGVKVARIIRKYGTRKIHLTYKELRPEIIYLSDEPRPRQEDTADTLAPVVAIADELTTAEDIAQTTTAAQDTTTADTFAPRVVLCLPYIETPAQDTTAQTSAELTTTDTADTLAPVVLSVVLPSVVITDEDTTTADEDTTAEDVTAQEGDHRHGWHHHGHRRHLRHVWHAAACLACLVVLTFATRGHLTTTAAQDTTTAQTSAHVTTTAHADTLAPVVPSDVLTVTAEDIDTTTTAQTAHGSADVTTAQTSGTRHHHRPRMATPDTLAPCRAIADSVTTDTTTAEDIAQTADTFAPVLPDSVTTTTADTLATSADVTTTDTTATARPVVPSDELTTTADEDTTTTATTAQTAQEGDTTAEDIDTTDTATDGDTLAPVVTTDEDTTAHGSAPLTTTTTTTAQTTAHGTTTTTTTTGTAGHATATPGAHIYTL